MVTPSLVIVGAPNFLSRTTLRPRGPSVTLTASASLSTPRSSARRASSSKLRIFAMSFLSAFLRMDLPARVAPGRQGRRKIAAVVWTFLRRVRQGAAAAGRSTQRGTPRPRGGGPGRSASGLLLDDGEDVARREHEVLLAGVLDLGAAVLAVEDDVADLDVQRETVAVVVDATRADREDGALLGLLLGGVRDDDARGSGGLGLVGLYDDAVLERLDADLGGGHGVTPLLGCALCVAGPICSGFWSCLRRRVVAVAGVNRPSPAVP